MYGIEQSCANLFSRNPFRCRLCKNVHGQRDVYVVKIQIRNNHFYNLLLFIEIISFRENFTRHDG